MRVHYEVLQRLISLSMLNPCDSQNLKPAGSKPNAFFFTEAEKGYFLYFDEGRVDIFVIVYR